MKGWTNKTDSTFHLLCGQLPLPLLPAMNATLSALLTPASVFSPPPPPGLPPTSGPIPGPVSSGPPGDASAADLQLPTFSTAALVRVVLTSILCAASTLCNVGVLWAASGHKRSSHVRVLILHLTAADLLVTLIVMPVDAAWNVTVQWLAGDAACRLLMFLKLQAMYSCAFVTVVISLDRQSAILNPLGFSEARRRNRAMLSVAWSMSLLLSAPQVRTHTRARTHTHTPTHTSTNCCCLFIRYKHTDTHTHKHSSVCSSDTQPQKTNAHADTHTHTHTHTQTLLCIGYTHRAPAVSAAGVKGTETAALRRSTVCFSVLIELRSEWGFNPCLAATDGWIYIIFC